MTRFIRRFIGVLALDATTYEEIEADARASVQAVWVVILTCLSGGFALMSWSRLSVAGFVAGSLAMVAAWAIWVVMISTIGTRVMSEVQTRSSRAELLRTLGFASAPGVLLMLAAIRPAAPLVLGVTAIWMIAAAVVGTRQALDYSGTTRAIAVCFTAWLLSFGVIAGIALAFSQTVR